MCLWSRWGLEVSEAVKQKVAPGVAGLVARDGAAGVAGDDGGDAQQAQGPGLPLSGRGAGKRQCLAEGEDVAGQGHDQAPGAGGQVLEHLGVIRT